MAENAEEENQQFEQVLNRLDALMKRSHGGEPFAATEQAASAEPDIYFHPVSAGAAEEAEPGLPVDAAAPDAVRPAEEAAIPVLTDVYEGPLLEDLGMPEAGEAVAGQTVPPEMLDALQRIIEEECGNLQRTLSARVQAEIMAVLRQP